MIYLSNLDLLLLANVPRSSGRLRELTLAAPQACFFNWLASGILAGGCRVCALSPFLFIPCLVVGFLNAPVCY